jgi:GNAT superfamily N-acetyltransferase
MSAALLRKTQSTCEGIAMLLRVRESLPLSLTPAAEHSGLTPTIRRLDHADLADVHALLTGLDQSSRCARFGFVASDLAQESHAAASLQTATCAIGIYVEDTLRGVLEVYCVSPDELAEVALVVAEEWRRRGLGTAMVRAATEWARLNGVSGLRLIFSRHNWPMRHLARKLNARLALLLDELCADIAVGSPAKMPTFAPSQMSFHAAQSVS